jgi:putative ABC transport system permease protein
MKYFHLVWAALVRRKGRTLFTLLSILMAFLLFGLLDSVRSAFSNTGQAGKDRLLTFSNINWGLPLPQSLYERIRAVPGVGKIEYASALGGTYQDPNNFIPLEGHADAFLDIYPEWQISPAEREAFLKTRTGVIASESYAKRFHWKVGDKIPLKTALYKKDGSTVWIFDLVGIYRIADPSMQSNEAILYARWDYVNEARQEGGGTVDWFATEVPDINQIDRVSRTIDALSANSDHETKTQTEYAFYIESLRQLADVGLIVGSIMGAVFFTLVLLTGNTTAQAVRERIPEFATMKAIGFSPASVLGLVLGESVLLFVLGSALGLIGAATTVYWVRSTMGPTIFMSPVGEAIWLRGLAIAVLVGLIVGALPAIRGMRLRVVDALSGR